jgi:metal transporter CNNM
LDETLKR